MAKWLTRWSAKPVFMGSNPIRCSNKSFGLSGTRSECAAFRLSRSSTSLIEGSERFGAPYAPNWPFSACSQTLTLPCRNSGVVSTAQLRANRHPVRWRDWSTVFSTVGDIPRDKPRRILSRFPQCRAKTIGTCSLRKVPPSAVSTAFKPETIAALWVNRIEPERSRLAF